MYQTPRRRGVSECTVRHTLGFAEKLTKLTSYVEKSKNVLEVSKTRGEMGESDVQ